MRLTLEQALQQIADRELWVWRQNHWRSKAEPQGANVVGDHDEDYVFDALFDTPNR